MLQAEWAGARAVYEERQQRLVALTPSQHQFDADLQAFRRWLIDAGASAKSEHLTEQQTQVNKCVCLISVIRMHSAYTSSLYVHIEKSSKTSKNQEKLE